MIDPNVLTEIGLFAGLRPDVLDVLRHNLRPLTIEAGQQLIEQGVTTRGPLVLITEGLLEVTRQDSSGTAHTLALLEPPTVVGEMEFLADAVSSATVTALDDVRGAVLSRARFEELLAEDEPAAFHLAVAIGRVVSDRLAATNALLTKMAERHG